MLHVFSIVNEMITDGVIEDYAIGGAIGASFYIEARATEDIDIFVHVRPGTPPFQELTEIYSYLNNKGFLPKSEFVVIQDWDVQFLIPGDGSLEDEAVKQANIIKYHDQNVRVMMPEYLAAISLQVGREKDIDRVRTFIKQEKVSVSDLVTLIERFHLEEQWQKVRMLI